MKLIPKKLFWTSCLIGLISCWGCDTFDTGIKQDIIFPNRDYTQVVAYHYNGDSSTIVTKEKLHPDIKKEKELSSSQIRHFLQIINSKTSYQAKKRNTCFRPKLGIVFYKKNKIVAHVSISLDCGQQLSSPINLQKQETCYSSYGLQQLMIFCQKLGFGECSETN